MFLSTLSLRRATVSADLLEQGEPISIHALLAESDGHTSNHGSHDSDFYPRSPCGERHDLYKEWLDYLHFYPRSPCGERQAELMDILWQKDFYPRSPCGERRELSHQLFCLFPYFYPRSPCGERLVGIKIGVSCYYFYPRSPCGERPLRSRPLPPFSRFLSTLSLRRATKCSWAPDNQSRISIHALLAESDCCVGAIELCGGRISIHALLAESDRRTAESSLPFLHFYPRSPCGERLRAAGQFLFGHKISIHALLAESDADGGVMTQSAYKFLSTLSLRRATKYVGFPAIT